MTPCETLCSLQQAVADDGLAAGEGKCGGRLLCSHRYGSRSEIARGILCKIYIDGLFASSYFGRFL